MTTTRPVHVPPHAAAQIPAGHLDRQPPVLPPTLSEGGGRGGSVGERMRRRGLPSRTETSGGGGAVRLGQPKMSKSTQKNHAAVRVGASMNRAHLGALDGGTLLLKPPQPLSFSHAAVHSSARRPCRRLPGNAPPAAEPPSHAGA
jgi:hypothetical protein